MSVNLKDQRHENRVIAEINQLQKQQSQIRTMQQQGSQAIRLAVVEGYMGFNINGLDANGVLLPPTASTFIDIEAPNNSPIIVGSLVHTAFMLFGPIGGSNLTIENWDDRFGGGFVNQTFDTWMTYASEIPNDVNNRPYDIPSAQAYRIADNRVRIGFRYAIGKGSVVISPALYLYCFFQLRMTLNWRGGD